MAKIKKFHCEDCLFFNEGTCKEEHFWRDVSGMDEICVDFEYKNEFKN